MKRLNEEDPKSTGNAADLVPTPPEMDQRILSYAWRIAREIKLRKSESARLPMEESPHAFNDFFVLAAAADSSKSERKTEKLKSSTGVYTIYIYEEADNPGSGLLVIEITADRAPDFEGRIATITNGDQILLTTKIEDGEAEGDIDLDLVDLDRPLSLKIE